MGCNSSKGTETAEAQPQATPKAQEAKESSHSQPAADNSEAGRYFCNFISRI